MGRAVQGVFASVSDAFSAMAAQQLDTLQRTETSLKRLKKARAGEGDAGPGAQLSDMDKILAQLSLDVQVGTLPQRASLDLGMFLS